MPTFRSILVATAALVALSAPAFADASDDFVRQRLLMTNPECLRPAATLTVPEINRCETAVKDARWLYRTASLLAKDRAGNDSAAEAQPVKPDESDVRKPAAPVRPECRKENACLKIHP
jgi:hypothetical protein